MKRSMLALAAAALTAVVAVVLSSVCSQGSGTTVANSQLPAATSEAAPAGAVLLTITRGGKVLHAWTLAGLRATVPFTQVTVDGEVQNGPLLRDVLAASAVGDWSHAVAIGKGPALASNVTVQIDASKIDHTWILDVTNRNTLKLAAAGLSRTDWARDVSEIRID